MPLTQAQLAAQIKNTLDSLSNNPNTDPVAAREQTANALAASIAAFVQGRTVLVTGVQPGGGVANGTVQ